MAEKITDDKLRGIINSEINNAIGFMGSNLTSQRKKSMDYDFHFSTPILVKQIQR